MRLVWVGLCRDGLGLAATALGGSVRCPGMGHRLPDPLRQAFKISFAFASVIPKFLIKRLTAGLSLSCFTLSLTEIACPRQGVLVVVIVVVVLMRFVVVKQPLSDGEESFFSSSWKVSFLGNA